MQKTIKCKLNDQGKGNIFLLLAAIIWGLSLVSQQAGMEVMGPWTFTAVRCTLGGISMIPLYIYISKKEDADTSHFSWLADLRAYMKPGLVCGALITAVIISQQYGLLYTTVGKAAFITALYIFITPIMGLFLKKKVERKIWYAVILAVIGLYFITMTKGFDGINIGDIWMLGTAVVYSIYIHVVDSFVSRFNAVKISCIQFLSMGLFSFIPSLLFESGDLTVENIFISIVPVLYAGLISAAGGYTLQMIGQKYCNPNASSLILSSETIFSLLAGWLILGEVLTSMEYLGCAIMTIAIVIAVKPRRNPHI